MQATKDNRLGTENITRLMISLAIPSVLAQIVNVLYNIVDRIYICLLYTSEIVNSIKFYLMKMQFVHSVISLEDGEMLSLQLLIIPKLPCRY